MSMATAIIKPTRSNTGLRGGLRGVLVHRPGLIANRTVDRERNEQWTGNLKPWDDDHVDGQYHDLPPDLRDLQLETEAHAPYGLDFYDTIFEVLDYDELSEIAALGGFPTRYPHWRFGMEYQQLSKGYRYGLQKIYEMVINNDPCYAYLLRCNQMVDQKLVMAHVYGHNDFFKNNIWFSQTNRKMMDETANHGNRIRSYMDRYGEETVENFIDSCLSLENLIDIHSPLIKRRDALEPLRFRRRRRGGSRDPADQVPEQGIHGLVHQPAGRPQGGGAQAGERAGEGTDQASRSRSNPSATSCCSSWSTPR